MDVTSIPGPQEWVGFVRQSELYDLKRKVRKSRVCSGNSRLTMKVDQGLRVTQCKEQRQLKSQLGSDVFI